MSNYIAEANRFMYDDNYIVEDRSTIVKSWEDKLKREIDWLKDAKERNDIKAIKK